LPVCSSLFVSALFPGAVLPSRVVLMFVTERSFHGHLPLNPYNFRYSFGTNNDCRIEKISFCLNGVELDGLPNDELYLSYLRMFLFTEQRDAGVSNNITKDMFRGGYFFSFHDLTTSLSASSVLQNPVTRLGQARYVPFTTFPDIESDTP
jgi:hypothetical protein